MDWFVAVVDPADMWKAHKSYALCELVFIIGFILIFFHGKDMPWNCRQITLVCFWIIYIALKQGGRWPFYVFATIFHGFTVEFMAYFFPHIDNFWHAQGIFTFVERRLPLYIVFLCTYKTPNFYNELSKAKRFHISRHCVLLSLIMGHVKDET